MTAKVKPVRLVVMEELLEHKNFGPEVMQKLMAREIGASIADLLLDRDIVPNTPIYLAPVRQQGNAKERTITIGVDIQYEGSTPPPRFHAALGTSLHEVMERANEDMRTHPERLRDSLFQNTKELTDGQG